MMFNRLHTLLAGPAEKREAHALYIALVEGARKPFFYTECGVPDTLDGRFDVIVLHVFLALRLLRIQEQTRLSRLLQESLYDDMDRSLREMGVGDMGISKRMKTMSRATLGRLEAYTESFADDARFAQALGRNLYRGAPVSPVQLARVIAYARGYMPPLPAAA